jgi:hypothetical protein
MATRKLLLVLSVIAAASPLSAATEGRTRTTTAPAGTPETRYCMWIEAVTGTLIEQVKCWTREEWARQGVDVDREWAKEGVRTIG